MHQTVILTATYNHPQALKELYESLKEQKETDFSWIIVNDGSTEDTENILRTIEEDNKVDSKVINKANGGKSSAINLGLDNLEKNVDFVLIVDDDERLKPDALSIVKEYVSKYIDSSCGVIHFNRLNEKGEIIATPPIDEDFFMSYQQFKSKKRYADGYFGYFTKKLGDLRFNIYAGEKYIAPSTLFMKVTRNSRLLWASAVLGETEYLAGGITKQGRRLRVRNPKGMIEYCELMQENGASLRIRLAYSAHGYAYTDFLSKNERVCNKKFLLCAKPMGKIIAKLWRKKYGE